ncbi:hypothetical protein PGQ11_007343 [Apiospora arundinis]|uniref:Uncharacterized protein n=1 Tax=Apiospora arundinis TaxID=335852 RepID=A0ABR2IVE7_9PEZI
MENQATILTDKYGRASGPVHRPSDHSGTSSVPLAELPGDEGSHFGELTSHPVKPPPYSTPSSDALEPHSAQSAGAKGLQWFPGLPLLDYRQYSPPMFDLSPDSMTISSKATYLSANATALCSLLQTLATVPPKQQILVQGNRGRKVDFAIKMNLMGLLVPSDPQDRLDYLRVVNRDEMACRGGSEKPSLQPDVPGGSLEEWCKRFVADQSPRKSFLLRREVANLDTEWLEGQLRSLVATTEYKGQVSVTFPVTHCRVLVQSPDKVNKFFTSVSALFTGKSKYEVVKAVWPFATAKSNEPGRRCIVQSEKVWYDEWKDPIKYAIATKRHGYVTNEDKLECIMESKGKGLTIDWEPAEY